MTDANLLIVDDDVELCELVREYLAGQGFHVDAAHDGERGAAIALEGRHDLIILDVMLPGIDGFEALRRLRGRVNTPILMLTARGDDVDRIIGLELGADDYLAKPCNPRELAARVRAILRRVHDPARLMAAPSNARIEVEDVTVNVASREAQLAGEPLSLTSSEFDLLTLLLRNAGAVVERGELFRRVLDRDGDPFDRSIDMHISHLRRKLGPRQDGTMRIKAVRSVGYLYAVDSPVSTAQEG
ncbi:MAG TPA: response regulator transcription factor [Phycisphaerae bacterium]|nr:response regulator transcription factor [Phycisphaerae bacterium]HRW54230.1 response regulator transcription factor [Phycisphaerae bacterium]